MKNYSFWLKGGIISLILYVIVTIALIPFGTTAECFFLCFSYWSIPTYAGALILLSPINLLTAYDITSSFFIGGVNIFIEASIFYFLVGAALGWIYGKIKNRKKKAF